MKRSLVKLITVLSLAFCGVTASSAQEQKPDEYQVKALFLYNFLNFIEYPADSSFKTSPAITVCIVGESPFEEAIEEIRDETVRGKRLAIKFYRPDDEPRGCHLLFVPAPETRHIGRLLRSIKGTGLLTVGDTEEATRQGAVIGFFMERNKVRFAINLDNAKKSGLKISAKLLRLARIVGTGGD